MKILIDARFYGLENAGLGRYTIELIKNLSKIDTKNNYVLLLRKKYFQTLKLPKNWEKVLVNYKHYTLGEQINLPKIIREINPDITHFLHFNVPLFAPKPYVVTIHDLIMHQSRGVEATTLPFYKYLIKRIGYKLVFKNSVKRAVKIVTPSTSVKEELVRFYKLDSNKISVTYLGIDKVFFASRKIVKKENYFLYVGNAYPHKNLVYLIKAVKKINTKLKIVTSRNIFYKRLKKIIENLNAEKNVELNSFLNDKELVDLYRKAKAFVYPSKIEGFGFQGLEAMASKTLLCASNIKIFKEIYKNNAIYFGLRNEKFLVNSLRKVLNIKKDEEKKRLDKAYKYAKKFSWLETAKKTKDIYEKLL